MRNDIDKANITVELACLYYEVRSRFYSLPLETYCDAMTEVGNMANACELPTNEFVGFLIR